MFIHILYSHTAVLDARAERVRQDWIKTMEARIVREELQKCRKAEGVNSYYYCKPLVETYLGLLRDAKVSGEREACRLWCALFY